jgi:hypothetical protein
MGGPNKVSVSIHGKVAEADRFILIFTATVTLTVVCGVLMGFIAILGPNPQPPPMVAVFDTLKYCFTVGMLSVFGLLRTRATNRTTQKSP